MLYVLHIHVLNNIKKIVRKTKYICNTKKSLLKKNPCISGYVPLKRVLLEGQLY